MDSEDDPRHWELEAIVAIYPEIQRNGSYDFSLVLKPTPAKPWLVRFPSLSTSAPTPRIAYLPPITLEVQLPDGYPESVAPRVKVRSEWLPDKTIEEVEKEAEVIWERNLRTESVYDIIDNVLRGIDTGFRLFQKDTWHAPDYIKDQILSCNKKRAREEFESGTYVCGICLDPCKGTVSHKLSHCGHVFCIDCLQGMYKNAIKTGDIAMVRCPDPECAKPKRKRAPPAPNGEVQPYNPIREPPMPPTMKPFELQTLNIPPDYIQRYLFMKRKVYLDADPNTIICPRDWCQNPSRSAVEHFEAMLRAGMLGEYFFGEKITASPFSVPSTAERMRSRLDICTKCGFAFCKVCEQSWHGETVICRGKNYVKSETELKDERYIASISTYCPGCECAVLKSEGCNHMSCKCGVHFCFLCGAYLNPDMPYAHFNTKGKWCYMKLWEGEDVTGGGRVPMEDYEE